MDERAEGLILRTRPLTDTSLIVQWLTPVFGRISTVAKGARRPNSLFSGKLDLYYEAAFSFQRSRRSELHILKEVKLHDFHESLRTDLHWLAQAAHAGQLIELVTETETPLAEVYDIFQTYLAALPNSGSARSMTLGFELKLLELLGYGPNLINASPLARQTAPGLVESDWTSVAGTSISQPLFIELNRIALMTLSQITDKVPTSRAKALLIR
jgi:DNA repair protein RecO (recombination protein O)